jgi:hypothetical protein
MDSASPAETSRRSEGESPGDDGTEPEREDAEEDEDIHDVALAAEQSGRPTHGHEVTFPPPDDDQGETIRIVTEAVELGEAAPPDAKSLDTDEPGGPVRPATSSPRARRNADHPEGPTGAAP